MHPSPFLDLPLWPNGAATPFSQPGDDSLAERRVPGGDGIVRVTDVAVPTLSFFPATGVAPRPAVLVCPGGGYGILAWNHEGTDIAAWLVSQGISAFLLKYRCPGRRTAALADAVRAMRLIRANATDWHVAPERIGTIGFSAGAHLSVALANLSSAVEPYAPVDDADALSSRPSFQFVIYPAYLDREDGASGVAPDIAVTPDTPPAFLFQAVDDRPYVASSFAYASALAAAGVSVELHLVPRGGHGYGLLHRGVPTDSWPTLAMEWFRREVIRGDVW